MTLFRDATLERELHLDGLDPQAARQIFADLTAYLGKPIHTIATQYWQYRQEEDVLAQRRVAEATSEHDVLAYYTATPHYLYELSYWEASADKQAWFRVLAKACQRYQLRRVIDVGGGVGGLCRYLQTQGIPCDYLDVEGNTFRYASWRFKRGGWPIRMYNVLAEWPSDLLYDAVTAWDVLEHLFDLSGAIERIARVLRPGGWFISKSTFAVEGELHLDIHLAKHAHYADVRELNQLLTGYGLVFKGQLKPNRLSRLLRKCGMPHAVAGIRLAPRLKHGGNFLVHQRSNGRARPAT